MNEADGDGGVGLLAGWVDTNLAERVASVRRRAGKQSRVAQLRPEARFCLTTKNFCGILKARPERVSERAAFFTVENLIIITATTSLGDRVAKRRKAGYEESPDSAGQGAG